MNGRTQAVQSGAPNPYRYNDKLERSGSPALDGELQTFLSVAGRSLGWYDYGARFYEPEIGRWQTVDPVAEWHFNQDPYGYCLNNPLRFVDRYGMDTTIALQPVYCIAPKPAPKTPNPPSLLARVVNKIGNALASALHSVFGATDELVKGGKGTVQEDGVVWYSSTGQGTPDKAKRREDGGSIDLLLPVTPEAGPFQKVSRVKAITSFTDRVNGVNQELGPVFTSDKDIKQATGDNTGNDGKPVVGGKYNGWKKDPRFPEAYKSPDGDSTLLIGPTGDSTMFVHIPGRNGSYKGELK